MSEGSHYHYYQHPSSSHAQDYGLRKNKHNGDTGVSNWWPEKWLKWGKKLWPIKFTNAVLL